MIRKLFLLLAAITSTVLTAGQQIPDDPHTTVGKLKNGMTYYLRHNSENRGCADFYIIHNVGALQEEDNQNGLAHFLEHMAFNGTERYPDKTILNFLEKDGVRFGYNVNAYTSRTETVYNISAVPLVRETFVDSVLYVLHDWSCAISCEEDALDAERGVISEEWRRKDEPRSLVADLQNNIIYNGSKHTRRNVIGTLEIINGFKRQEILDFYHKWYRPDLQAIAIVGDIDAEDMEERIKKIFSDIPSQENPAAKEEYIVPGQDGPVFKNMLDPRIKFNTLRVIHKQPYTPEEERNTNLFYKDKAVLQIANEIVKERFSRITQNDDCPAKNIAVVSSELSDDFYTTVITISPRSEDLQEEVLVMYATEIRRLLEHGFTADELKAAKFQAIRRLKSNPSETVRNREWADVCLEHFLRGEALISPARKKEIQSMLVSETTDQEVMEGIRNMLVDCEKIYSYSIEEGKTDLLPTKERMQQILSEVESSPIEPDYPEFQKIDFNIDTRPGTIVKASSADRSDFWSLSNGAEIIREKSDPVKSSNNLVIKAVFNTGFKAMPRERMGCSRVAATYISRNFGFRNYSRKDLRDNIESGNISMTLEIERDESTISLICGKEDADKAFKMLHLVLTEPYFDTDKSLERFKNTQIRSLEKDKSERSEFDRQHRRMRYGNNPWRSEITKEHYQGVDMDLVRDVFRRNFGRMNGLKVYICDDMDTEKIQEWCCRYIASVENTADTVMQEQLASWPQYRGRHRHIKSHPVKAVPKSEVNLNFKYDIKLNNKEFVIFDILDYIMNARCMNQIREERGGTYSVTFSTEVFPQGKIAESSIVFQTRPELTDLLVDDAHRLVEEMAKKGPSEEEFENARKYLAKRYQEVSARDKENLSRKMDRLVTKNQYGIDRQDHYMEILEKISRKDVRKMAERLVKGDSMLSVYTEE